MKKHLILSLLLTFSVYATAYSADESYVASIVFADDTLCQDCDIYVYLQDDTLIEHSKTDELGQFKIYLPSKKYKIKIAKKGFENRNFEDIDLTKFKFINIGIVFLKPVNKINQKKLEALIKKAKQANSSNLYVWHKGKMVFGENFDEHTGPIEAMSVTKSVSVLAIGKLWSDGLIDSLSIPLYHYFPEWKQGKKKYITLENILNHTSGIDNPQYTGDIYPFKDHVQLALVSDITGKTDSTFFYNNKALNLIAEIVKKVSGKRMDKYIQDEIFSPLEINTAYWYTDRFLYALVNEQNRDTTLLKEGNPSVMAHLQIDGKDLNKIGQLVLHNGKWNDQQIIKKEWFDLMLSPSKVNKRCGLLWWLVDDPKLVVNSANQIFETPKSKEDVLIYEANGSLGQYILVYPKDELVISRMIHWSYDYKYDNEFVEIYQLGYELIERK